MSKHFDPLDELTKEEIDECTKRTKKQLEQENDKVLNLEKSTTRVPGQEWALISFVGKGCRQSLKVDELGAKIWGTFPSIEEAKVHAKQLQAEEENKYYDIFILEMYCWAKIPPDPTCIDDQNYHEEKLHELITGHKESQMQAKQLFDMRKNKLMNNPDINKEEFEKQLKNKPEGAGDAGDAGDDEPNEKIKPPVSFEEVFGKQEKLPPITITEDPIPEATPTEILEELEKPVPPPPKLERTLTERFDNKD